VASPHGVQLAVNLHLTLHHLHIVPTALPPRVTLDAKAIRVQQSSRVGLRRLLSIYCVFRREVEKPHPT